MPSSGGSEAEGLREIWAGLGLPGAVDVHTHFMPPRVMRKVWAYFDQAGPLTGRPWPITYREHEDRRVQRLREFGVTAFTSLLYPHKPDMAAWLNAWAADFARRTPECVPTATFYPEDTAARYVAQAIAGGARIFKAHLQVGDYDPNDPLLDAVWGMIEDERLPVVVHCGSGPAPGRFTGPARMATLLSRHPRLRLIVAHLGLPEYAEFLDLTGRFDGVHLDTTMVFTDFTEQTDPFPPGQVARLAALGDRVLFGSDFPNIPYPYAHAVEALIRLDLGDGWLRGVFHDNARRLLGVPSPIRCPGGKPGT